MLSVLGGEGVSGPRGLRSTYVNAETCKASEGAACRAPPHTQRVCSGSLQPLHRTLYVHYLEQVVSASTSGTLTHVHSYIQRC